MAKKKRVRRKKSSVHKKVMSAHPSRRKRKSSSRKHGLSEAFTAQGAKHGMRTTVGGGIGGAVAYGLDAVGVRKLPMLGRIGVFLGASFVTSAMMGMDNVAAGIAGAGGYAVLQGTIGGMSEMEAHPYTKQGVLNEYPDAMDEAGNPMYLSEDGTFYYLEDGGEMNLAASMQADLYPNYVNSSGF